MDKVHRFEADLTGVFKQVGGEIRPLPTAQDSMADPAATAHAAGWKSAVKRTLRVVAVRGWRAIRPFVRSPMHRLRNFMVEPQRNDLAATREALRQDIINTQTWAHQENQALAAMLARATLSLRDSLLHETSRIIGNPRRLETNLLKVEEYISDSRARHDELTVRLERVEAYALKSAARQAIPVGRGRVMVRTAVGYMLCDETDTALLAQLIESGELEPGTRLFIESYLRPGMTFVDVGANIGMHTVAAGKALRGAGRIVAFEPFPGTAALLDENVWNNGLASQCEIHRVALAAQSGEHVLFLGRTSGHHSLFPLDSEAPDSPRIQVKVETLDDALGSGSRVDLLKIDAEGAELDIIRGARDVLKVNPGIALVVEFGASHLARKGIDAASWIAEFAALGFGYQAIDDVTGTTSTISATELIERGSVNLLLVRAHSS